MMMSFGMMLMMLGGSGNQLLDVVESKAYWDLQGVAMTVEAMQAELGKPDVETIPDLLKKAKAAERPPANMGPMMRIVAMGPDALPKLKELQADSPEAGGLIQMIGEMPGARLAHRLLAIRTLGELKKPEAIATLTPLTKSEEPFVAEYAREAIAAIQGKPLPAAKHDPKVLAGDLAAMPEGLGLVLQATMTPGDSLKMDEIIKTISPMMSMSGQEPSEEEIAQFRTMMMNQVMQVIYRVGNVRLDCATIGVAEDMSKDQWAVLRLRGQYVPEYIERLIAEGKADTGEKIVKTVAGQKIWSPDDDVHLWLRSDRELVLIPGDEDTTPLATIVTAIATGKGGVTPESPLGKLMVGLPADAALRLATTLPKSYTDEAEFLAPFQSATVALMRADGKLKGAGVAAGQDEEGAAATEQLIQDKLAEVKGGLADVAEEFPVAKDLLTMLESVKLSRKGGTLTITGQADIASPFEVYTWLMTMVRVSMPSSGPSGPPPAQPEDDF